jgi:hypothetical protein
MPWQWGWPPYVSRRVLDDKERASADLDQSSEDLTEAIRSAGRVHRIADSLDGVRRRNHFSESMELLFAQPPHLSRLKDTQ